MSRPTAPVSWVTAFLLVFAVYSFFLSPPGPNELSRYDLLLSLARDHTVAIDRYHLNTFDKATFGGHEYTDKAIGTSLLGLPWWWMADRFYQFGEYGEVRTDLPLWAATAGGVSLPSALLVLLVFWLARELSGSRGRALSTTAAYGFGTIAFPFATMFYGHQPAAFLGFAAFVVAFQGQQRKEAARWFMMLAGWLSGWAVLTEYPAAIIALLVGVYALSSRVLRPGWWAYVVGLAAGLVPLGIYNLVAFGGPWRLGYGFVSDPSFGGMSAGVLGVTLPRPEALYEITLGEAGLFTRSPFLLLAAVGFGLWWRSQRFRREALLCAAVSITFFLYNAGYYLPMGGSAVGPRFLLPSLPFLALALVFLPRWGWWLAAPAAMASAALMLMITSALPKAGPGAAGTSLVYWYENLWSGQVIPTWGNLRYGLEGTASLGLLMVPVAVGSLLWVLSARKNGDHRRTTWAGLALAALTYGVVALPLGTVPTLFAPPPLEAAGARPLSIVYDDRIELLAYRLDREAPRPGDRLALTLYWRSRAPIHEDYTVFIHLLGKDGEVLGAWDIVPGAGAYPTSMWTPGRVVAETYWVPLSQHIPTPTLCRVEVGFYDFTTMRRLLGATREGMKLGDSPLLARIAVREERPQMHGATPMEVDFGGQVALVGYLLDETDPSRLRGRLYWRAGGERLERDYTVFVQALRGGQVVAQWDSQPLGGRYPTSLWAPGELVEDWFELALDAKARQGTTIIAGMYDLATMQRLPVGDTTFVELGG